MEKQFDILLTRRTGNLIALSMILFFVVLSIIRLYPFQNSINDILNSTDDWGRYARFAMDVKHNGISMPSMKENYFAPAGFLYIYFVALCFYLFGENTVPILIIQNLLLGISIAFIYFSFRDKMKSSTSLIFLITLFLFALLDVSKYYSFRLLSENLALFTVSAFFFCFIMGTEKNKLSLQLLAGALLGLSILIRPNLFPFAFILPAIVPSYYLKQKKGMLKFFLFILVLLLSSSLLALRNYVACRSWTFLPAEGVSFGNHFLHLPSRSLTYYFNKIIFFLGFLSSLEPNCQWRPHWTLMWIGYVAYLFFRAKIKTKFELWEVITHAYIFCYYALMLFIAPQVSSYGFRLLVPVLFFVLPFSCMAFDKFAPQKNKANAS